LTVLGFGRDAKGEFKIICDIRINTPELRNGGRRVLTTEVKMNP